MNASGLFITGTDTDVGKTWVTAQLITELVRQNIPVTPRKPIESGWNTQAIEQTDSWKLAKAAQQTRLVDQVCPFRFKAALSPPRAAALENKHISTEQISRYCIDSRNAGDFLIVEGAGGFYSPLTSDGLNADVAHALQLPVLLVVNDTLGCINHTLLTLEAVHTRQLTCMSIVLNQMNPEQHPNMDNKADLQALTSCSVIRFQDEHALPELVTLIQALR